MLVHHEPNLDPRIQWEAMSASGRFEVTVLGFHDLPGRFPREEEVDGYRIVRVDRVNRFVARYLARLFSLLATGRERFFILFQIPFFALAMGVYFLVHKLTVLIAKRVPSASKPVDSVRRAVTTVASGWIQFIGLFGGFAQTTETLLRGYSAQEPELDPDIVHCNDLETLLAGVCIKLKHGCRLVYDAHELWPASRVGAPFYQVRWFTHYEKRLIKYADKVLTVSPQLARIMKEWYGLEEVLVLPNAEPCRRTLSGGDRAPVPVMEGPAKGRIKFLVQGLYSHGRGFEKLIKAWRRVDHAKAVLFLRGPGWPYVEELRELAARCVPGDGIYFLDSVAEDELVPAAREADVGIIPYEPVCLNHQYCCPNKLSVYLQAGLAIVANDLPFVKELLSRYDCGLAYDSRDEESMIAAFNQLIEDGELRERYRKNSLRASREDFNWEKFSHVLLEAYGE